MPLPKHIDPVRAHDTVIRMSLRAIYFSNEMVVPFPPAYSMYEPCGV